MDLEAGAGLESGGLGLMEGKSFREGRSGPQSLVPQKGKIEFGKCPLDLRSRRSLW